MLSNYVINSPQPLHGANTAGDDEFTSSEWRVIALGIRAGMHPFGWSVANSTPAQVEPSQPPKRCPNSLEALRRMAALAWQFGWETPVCEMGAFLRAGWSEEQLELLIECTEWGHARMNRPAANIQA